MIFEWDTAKERINFSKHGVPFPYAARLFQDPYRVEEQDTKADYGEVRWRTLGMVDDYVLMVVYVERDEVIRIISARRAERHERRRYHEIRARP